MNIILNINSITFLLFSRNKRSTKLSISLYENDDPYDLSDYGIGLNRGTSETESNKSTEDASSIVSMK